MRTTLNINDALLAELRSRAQAEGRTFRAVLEEALHKGLAAESSSRSRFEVQPLDPGIKAAYQGMSLNQLYDQIEAEL